MTYPSGLPNAYSYPNFDCEVVASRPAENAQSLLAFPSKVKGKRKDDLVVFGLGSDDSPADVSLFENPRNRDKDT